MLPQVRAAAAPAPDGVQPAVPHVRRHGTDARVPAPPPGRRLSRCALARWPLLFFFCFLIKSQSVAAQICL